MKFSHHQVFLLTIVAFSSPILAVNLEKINNALDNIFLTVNITEEETKSILAFARDSYQILVDYNKETDQDLKKELLIRVKTFANCVINDLVDADVTLHKLFQNVNSYLKGVWNASNDDGDSLKTTMPKIIKLLDQKISQQNSQSLRNRYDVKRILSGNEDFLRENDSINSTTIGYFFLEAFATIFGLSWGIISMILSDFQ